VAIGGVGLEIVENAILLPAVAAAVTVLGLAWLLRDRTLPVALAITFGFLVAFQAVRGVAPAWPQSASDKLPLLALLGLAMTLFVERRGRPLVAGTTTILGVVGFIAWREIEAGRVSGPLTVAGTGIAIWQATRQSPRSLWRRHWTLAAMALALAGVALFARTVLIAQLALACCAVLLASAIRPAATPEALLPGFAVLVGLATSLALFSEASGIALALSGAIAAGGWGSDRLARVVPVPEPLLFVGFGIVAAAAATGLTRWLEGPPLYYG
jgi:hypothetical protein